MYSQGYRFFEVEVARRLASSIPNAELGIVEGAGALWDGDPASKLQAIERFLGGSGPRALATGDVVTILFTDLASSTALTQRLGDARAQELLREHNTIVREALSANGGSEIKHTGDGVMASFATASGALECAVAIQRAVAAQDDANLQVHVGLNAGEPVAEDSDLFGTAVQLARRICDAAQAGEILVSNVVRELSAGKGFLFADRGGAALKGFEDPVRLYEVRWRDGA
jgi:class 3 adenylate cyclase